jgi:hypothetical protein
MARGMFGAAEAVARKSTSETALTFAARVARKAIFKVSDHRGLALARAAQSTRTKRS